PRRVNVRPPWVRLHLTDRRHVNRLPVDHQHAWYFRAVVNRYRDFTAGFHLAHVGLPGRSSAIVSGGRFPVRALDATFPDTAWYPGNQQPLIQHPTTRPIREHGDIDRLPLTVYPAKQAHQRVGIVPPLQAATRMFGKQRIDRLRDQIPQLRPRITRHSPSPVPGRGTHRPTRHAQHARCPGNGPSPADEAPDYSAPRAAG